jgi:ATP-dependent DNA helicase RecG
MAPTEVLAQQHYFNLTQLLEPLGIRCGYLANSAKAEDREKTLADIASGQIQIAVGTHALIQSDVRFQKLGLAVIDEQHKFGVFQRATLKEKAKAAPHCLLLTATPIPRTLALTLYGDLDISEINEMPKGRKPIQTVWVGENRRSETYSFLDGLLEKGRQAYVICPLIETEDGKIKSASQIHAEMAARFPHRQIGLLHGRMKSDAKNKVMQEFKAGKLQVLVSTVVIEVGVDVPNATAMIIENAERFGLAQLHQLRGRVGRGSEESFCILFSDATQEDSVERLSAFERIRSGFEIAETDLELRGSGDIIGEKQHGLQRLRIGDLVRDMDILRLARVEAQKIVEKDPKLTGSDNRLLKMEIQERFGRDQAKIAVFN